MDNHSCKVCQEYFSSQDPDRLPKIMLGCGCTVCSSCAENQAHYGTGSSAKNPFPSLLLCPACHLETFLPSAPQTCHDEQQSVAAEKRHGRQAEDEHRRKQQQQQQQQQFASASATVRIVRPPPNVPVKSLAKASFSAISRLPTNYNLLPNPHHEHQNQQQQQQYPPCAQHALPRAFYCPSHGTASCLHCINEFHRDCPFRACEVKEAKPILLQSLNHTRHTLENSLSRSEALKQNLTSHHVEVEKQIYETHCNNVVAWMDKCLEIGFQSLGNAHLLHQQRLQTILNRCEDLEKTERLHHAALRALDTADSLPATALIDALPLLATTVDVPDVSICEEEMRGIDNPPGPIPPSVLPQFAAQFGERVLVADHGSGFLNDRRRRQQQQQTQQKERNPFCASTKSVVAGDEGEGEGEGEGDETTSVEGTSLHLVDLETKTVLCTLLNSNVMQEKTKITDKERNEENVIDKVIDHGQFPSLKSPNGICEVITEIEVDDKSSMAGMLYQAQRERLKNLGILDDDDDDTDDDDEGEPLDQQQQQQQQQYQFPAPKSKLNFYNISPSRVYDATFSSSSSAAKEAAKPSLLSPYWKSIVTASPDASIIVNKNVNRDERPQFVQNKNSTRAATTTTRNSTGRRGRGGAGFKKPTKKVLRTEFAICDTLGHRIVLIDATTGKMTRQISQTLRGTCLNEFSPFGICPVLVSLDDDDDDYDYGGVVDHHRQQEFSNATKSPPLPQPSYGSMNSSVAGTPASQNVNIGRSRNESFTRPNNIINNNARASPSPGTASFTSGAAPPSSSSSHAARTRHQSAFGGRSSPPNQRKLDPEEYPLHRAGRNPSPPPCGRQRENLNDSLYLDENTNNSNNNDGSNKNSQQHLQMKQQKILRKHRQKKTAALLVTDCDNHRVHLIDAESGDFLRYWGNFRGSSSEEFWSPLGVAQIPDTALFAICDSGNHRIVIIHIGHSGSLFCIDLFSGVKQVEFQRIFPSSVCVIPEATYCSTSNLPLNTSKHNNNNNNNNVMNNKNNSNITANNQNVDDDDCNELITSNTHHQTVQLAIACKQPSAERTSDCVILLDFAFDLTRVIRSRFESGGPTTMFGGQSFDLSSGASASAVGRSTQLDASFTNRSSSQPPPEITTTAFRLSKVRSFPPRTLFVIPASPVPSKHQHSSKSSLEILSTPHRSSLNNASRFQQTEIVFDMLNQEFSRSANVLEQFQVLNAIAPCPLTLTTITASSSIQSAESWTRRMFSSTDEFLNNDNNNNDIVNSTAGRQEEKAAEDPDGTTHDKRIQLLQQQQQQQQQHRFVFSNNNGTTSGNRNRHVVGSSVLVVSDRNNRCVWTMDPVTGRLYDRIGGKGNHTHSSRFGAPSFVYRITPSLRVDPAPIEVEKIFAVKKTNAAAPEQAVRASDDDGATASANPLQKRETLMFAEASPTTPPTASSASQGYAPVSKSVPHPQLQEKEKQKEKQPERQTGSQQHLPSVPPAADNDSNTIDPATLDPRTRLTRMYKKYNPTKLSSVDGLLKQFEGAEEALFRTARERYGPEPTDRDEAKIYAVDPRSRLVRYYQKYNSSKLEYVDKTLQQFEGMNFEETLFEMLREKYGPEPIPGENFDASDYISEEAFLARRRAEKLSEIEAIGRTTTTKAEAEATSSPPPRPVIVVSVPTRSGGGPILPTTQQQRHHEHVTPPMTINSPPVIVIAKSVSASVDSPAASLQEPNTVVSAESESGPTFQEKPPKEQVGGSALTTKASEPAPQLQQLQQQQEQSGEEQNPKNDQGIKVQLHEPKDTTTNKGDTDDNNQPSGKQQDDAPPPKPLEKEEIENEEQPQWPPPPDEDEDIYRIPDDYDEPQQEQEQQQQEQQQEQQKEGNNIPAAVAGAAVSPDKSHNPQESESERNSIDKVRKAVPAEQEQQQQRLTRFYQKYNQEKLSSVETTLAQWEGKHEELFKILVSKYGPEPKGEKEEEIVPAEKTVSPPLLTPASSKTPPSAPAPSSSSTTSLPPPPPPPPKPVATKVEVTVPVSTLSPPRRPVTSPTEWRTRLERFYKKYNPEKLSSLDDTMKQWKGKETELFKNLVSKYGAEPKPDDEIVPVVAAPKSVAPTPKKISPVPSATAVSKAPAASPKPNSPAPTSTKTMVAKLPIHASPAASSVDDGGDWKKRLIRFYEKYNKEKVSSVDETLKQWKGKEMELMKNLISKYGAEPTEHKEEDENEKTKESVGVSQLAASPSSQDEKKAGDKEQEPQNEVTKTKATTEEPTTTKPPPAQPKQQPPPPPPPQQQQQNQPPLSEKERLTRFYQKYNPDKLSSVDDTLKQWKGQEASLFKNLVAKYGPEPPAPRDESSSSPSSSSSPGAVAVAAVPSTSSPTKTAPSKNATSPAKKSPAKKSPPAGSATSTAAKTKSADDVAAEYYKSRLKKFYTKYAPQKTDDDMNKLLKDFKGKESRLFEILCGKYGPEPQ